MFVDLRADRVAKSVNVPFGRTSLILDIRGVGFFLHTNVIHEGTYASDLFLRISLGLVFREVQGLI